MPIFPAEPISPIEIQTLLQVYNYEIQQICEVKVGDECRVQFVSADPKEQFEEMNAKIKIRPVRVDETIYAIGRDNLIKKYEEGLKKQSLIDKL